MPTRSLKRSLRGAAAAGCIVAAAGLAGAAGYPERYELGLPASPDDIAKVAMGVMPDGRGLPPGKGDYAAGKAVYEASCQACHGANLMGVADLPDMPSGAALRLIGGRGTLATPTPMLTVESYWPYATTLFDYIRRAMPFTAPGSLGNDEVYAVTAFILGEAKIIDRSTSLDQSNLAQVNMPNRDGFIPDPRPEFFK
ncbi:MAG TPA: cytochrome c [Alphaproteobacteria bacterium]